MTWIDVLWTMIASASLTLAFIHLFVWFKQKSQPAHLWFFALGLSVPAFGVFELLAMKAETAAEYAVAARWAQVPLFVVIISIVGFVHTYFGTGRTWLAYAVVVTRALSLLLNFTTGVSVLHRELTGIAHVALWGDVVVSAPIGVLSPGAVIPQISNVLLLAFVVDASVTLWRRRGRVDRRRAALVGGALVSCVTIAGIMGASISAGWLHAPTPLTPLFFLVVLAMGYELGWDVLHAAHLSRELRESERRTDLAAQAAALTFWSWDPGRDEVWLTAKGRAMFELDDSARIDIECLVARAHPDDRAALYEAMKNAIRDGTAFEQQFRLVHLSGQVRWVEARGQVETDNAGTPALLRGVATDITARWHLEREAAQQRSELAHLSRVTTLGELSGSLAHEINQPLMGILSNAQAAQRFMASDPPNLEEVREILADIVEDDKRAGEVIRRLRVLLKKGEVQRGMLDVGQVVDDVLRLTRNDLMNRDVTTSAELTTDLPAVLGDRIQLQQVLLNLVLNACDAMEGTKGCGLSIGTRFVEGAGVEVSVSDRGIGIPPADLERIFEPFVTTKEHGTGLGLAVCRTIIAAHGGRLWAENNAGGGATFRFLLPVVADAE